MTSNRMSMIFRPETEFGKGGSGNWYAPPPVTTWTDTFSRATNQYTPLGSKSWEIATYGKISGTFKWKFYLDYNYLEPLALAYEGWQENKCLDEDGSVDPSTQRFRRVKTLTKSGTHIFYKTNAKRVRSFEVRTILLNRVVGGEYDEVRIIRGCTSKGISYGMQNSAITCDMDGTASSLDIYYVYAESTDYIPYSEESLVEWACYLQDGEEYVKTITSLSFKATFTTEQVYSTCGPLSQNYTESGSTYTMSIGAYTDDYNKFRTRAMFSGGDVFSGDFEEIGGEGEEDTIIGKKYSMATRGLKPMKKAVIQSSTTNMVAKSGDQPDAIGGNAFTFHGDNAQAANAFKVTLYNAQVTSGFGLKGDANSQMNESLELNGNMYILEVCNNNAHVWRNYVKKSELAQGIWRQVNGSIDREVSAICIPDATYTGCPNEISTNMFDISASSDTDCDNL